MKLVMHVLLLLWNELRKIKSRFCNIQPCAAMDGGASGHLRHDVECATVAKYSKPAFKIFLSECSSKRNTA